MKKDHREFLISLQEELKTQPNDGNASPVFWVIMDYKWTACTSDDEIERLFVYDSSSVYGDEISSFMTEFIDENEDIDDEIREEGLRVLENVDWDEMESWLENNHENELLFIPQCRVEKIVPDTLFITKSSAKKHIELNQHHYSEKAHTYAMTAWRSPVVEELWDVLRNANFSTMQREIE